MPDDVKTENTQMQDTLKEIREERREEQREASWTRWIALTTALLAVLAALSTMQSGGLVNSALMLKNESVLKQAQASDCWSYYQAKGLKRNGAQQTADVLAASPTGAALAKQYADAAQRYKTEQDGIAKDAKRLEQERDAKDEEAAKLLERHHKYAFCVTFTQVAIALSAVAALTKRRPVWLISLLLGTAGLAWFIDGILR